MGQEQPLQRQSPDQQRLTTAHVRLELRPQGDSFAGRATSDTESREFHGWLGLMGAIEALYPAANATPVEEKTQARR